MKVLSKSNKVIHFQAFSIAKVDALLVFFQSLSDESKNRFGPHAFDRETLLDLFYKHTDHVAYIAIDETTEAIVAYFVVKKGYLQHDESRLKDYGLMLSMQTDCTIAPSVSDSYQGQGIGTQMFRYVLADLKKKRFERVILWGGVQSNNEKAVKLYQRFGFNTLGQFEYYGMNEDMILEL